MRLLLLRHAPTPDTGKRLSGRQPGLHITSEGARHAERAGAALTGYPVAAVYTSPVLRCRETARLAARAWEAKPVPLRGFTEVDYGEWTGRPISQLRRTKLWRQVMFAPSGARFPGGESLLDVQARAADEIRAIADDHGRGVVVVLSHADVIRLLVAHLAGIHADHLQRLVIDTGSVTAVALSNGVPRIVKLNDTGDLSALRPARSSGRRLRG